MKPFLSRKKLKPFWIFKSPEKFRIWKIFPTRFDKILCELRDLEKRLVKFICLSTKNGERVWENLNIDEMWWVQISDSDEDLFFLCEFKRPDFPIQGKIYAVDSETGKILWENSEYNFLFALNGKVYTVKNLIEQRFFFELDSRTGEVIQEFGESPEFINELRELKSESMNFIETSLPFDEYHPDYNHLSENIKPFIENADLRFPPEILTKRNFAIINYHTLNKSKLPLEAEKFSSILKIINLNENKLIYEDVLYSDLSSFIPDAFFCKDDLVFYVKNQSELIAIKLPISYEDHNG
ncbi:DUF4905 domain-containing protein [Candidatus Kryptobacter tengchongensis]|uniref:DUF4905 domain-containing protein n=1 Tax=Kryptobacter tengchongensis TaxID=1643429 RepID=UPI0007074C76|nr:DUF4905 domain-containing protein [Candidatus Kryptobacter tengchongensis]CUS85492.1 protein of unknown function (DUF4905) [Candidatus Kryptobacter tengchongensis]